MSFGKTTTLSFCSSPSWAIWRIILEFATSMKQFSSNFGIIYLSVTAIALRCPSESDAYTLRIMFLACSNYLLMKHCLDSVCNWYFLFDNAQNDSNSAGIVDSNVKLLTSIGRTSDLYNLSDSFIDFSR